MNTRGQIDMRVQRRRKSSYTGNELINVHRRRCKEDKNAAKIFVGNIAWNTTKDELRTFLSRQFGDVANLRIVKNPFTGLPKGFAFVKFCDPISAAVAIEQGGKHELNGRILRFNDVTEPKAPDSSSEEVVGFTSEEVVGFTCEEVVGFPDPSGLDFALEA